LVVICGLVLTVTYLGFSPPYSSYFPIIHKALNPGDFALDPLLADSVYLKSSIYYPIISFLDIPITNDLVGLALHYLLNGTVLYLVYLVARRKLEHMDAPSALTLTLVTCFLTSTFVLGALSSSLTVKTPTPTGLGHIAGMAALLFGILRRPGVAVMLATLCIAIAPKGTILIVPGLFLYQLIDRQVPRWALAWFAMPLAYIGWRMIDSPVSPMSSADLLELVEMILAREEEDGQFIRHPILSNAYFWVSVGIFPLLARTCPDNGLRKIGWAFLVVTAGAVAFNIAYSFLYQYLPVPLLAMLSIPQATKYFLFIVGLLIASWIIRTPSLMWYERIAGLLALVILKPLPAQSIVAALLIFGGIVLPRLLIALSGRDNAPARLLRRSDQVMPVGPVMGLVLAAFIFARIAGGGGYASPSWIDPVAFRNSGSWSGAVWASADSWKDWQSLAARKDFPLLVIYKMQPPGKAAHFDTHPAAYVATRKSAMATLPAHAYLNLELWRESQKRYQIQLDLLDRLNTGRPITNDPIGTIVIRKEGVQLAVNEQLIDFLAARNVSILVPTAQSGLFPPGLSREMLGAHVLLKF